VRVRFYVISSATPAVLSDVERGGNIIAGTPAKRDSRRIVSASEVLPRRGRKRRRRTERDVPSKLTSAGK